MATMNIHAEDLKKHDLLEWDGSLVEVKFVHLADDVPYVYWTAWDLWSDRLVILPPLNFGHVVEIWFA